jgi:hypothetical protein
MVTRRVDTRALIDNSSFGGYQIGVFLLCFMAMAMTCRSSASPLPVSARR